MSFFGALNPNPRSVEVKLDKLVDHMLVDHMLIIQLFAYNFAGKRFYPTSCGMIRNQHEETLRFKLSYTYCWTHVLENIKYIRA